tara:strand:- start:41 stop:529 length:489 start_codon:yes stop_codon:yes gene_type:complete
MVIYLQAMIDEIKEIVEYALYKVDSYSDDALALVVRTGMAESGYRALKGYGEGNPAIGFFQIEPATMYDMMRNYIVYRAPYRRALEGLGMEFKGDDIVVSVMSNIGVQAALCRLHYRRDKDPIPPWDDLEGQAEYWKRVYNTNLGRGTTEHFIEANKKIGFD